MFSDAKDYSVGNIPTKASTNKMKSNMTWDNSPIVGMTLSILFYTHLHIDRNYSIMQFRNEWITINDYIGS